MKISSITIAKNESANIGRCISSLIGVMDEIIILIDNSTTDNTEQIVQTFPQCSYKLVQWQGYGTTKQLALSLTTNEWVFWIDADEALSEELKNELLTIKSRDSLNLDAYAVPRVALFLNRWIKHSGWYPGYITRLFKKSYAKFTTPEVHEGLTITGKTGKLHADLLHYTDPNIAHYFEKFNNYTSLAALELQKKNKPFSLVDIIIRPPFLFFKMYFLKLGFLDGLQGLILAFFSSFYVFVKYAKLWERNQESKNK